MNEVTVDHHAPTVAVQRNRAVKWPEQNLDEEGQRVSSDRRRLGSGDNGPESKTLATAHPFNQQAS